MILLGKYDLIPDTKEFPLFQVPFISGWVVGDCLHVFGYAGYQSVFARSNPSVKRKGEWES